MSLKEQVIEFLRNERALQAINFRVGRVKPIEVNGGRFNHICSLIEAGKILVPDGSFKSDCGVYAEHGVSSYNGRRDRLIIEKITFSVNAIDAQGQLKTDLFTRQAIVHEVVHAMVYRFEKLVVDNMDEAVAYLADATYRIIKQGRVTANGDGIGATALRIANEYDLGSSNGVTVPRTAMLPLTRVIRKDYRQIDKCEEAA